MTYPWIHVISLLLYAAATFAIAVYYIPRARAEPDPGRRMARAARAMKVYDPFSIAVLGVMIMSGAFALTSIKDALREKFFVLMGTMLFWKLLVTFALIIVASYLAFGLGNRLVGKVEIGETPDAAWVASVLTRIQVVASLVLVLCSLIVWIAVSM